MQRSRFNLASLYLTGNGVAQSFQKAVLWYTQALDRGHTPAASARAVLKCPRRTHGSRARMYFQCYACRSPRIYFSVFLVRRVFFK